MENKTEYNKILEEIISEYNFIRTELLLGNLSIEDTKHWITKTAENIIKAETERKTKTKKLFRIFEWHDINNGIGRGKTKTYLRAETQKEAVLKFGEANDIEAPWIGYGADERTMKEFEQELKEMYKKMAEINDLYEDLDYIYSHEIEND